MSGRSTEVTAWVSHFGARKLRLDEAIAELKRAQRVCLQSSRMVELGLTVKPPQSSPAKWQRAALASDLRQKGK
jgi:hypothetical protein